MKRARAQLLLILTAGGALVWAGCQSPGAAGAPRAVIAATAPSNSPPIPATPPALDRNAVYEAYKDGLLADFRGELEHAIAGYRRAAQLAPMSEHLQTELARKLMQADRIDEATAVAHELLAIRPDSVKARLILGEAYDRLGLRRRAVEEYNQAVALDPAQTQAWKRLAAIHLVENDYGEAARCLQELLKIDRDLSYHHYYYRRELARCYMHLNRYPEAAAELEACLAVQPDADGYYDLGTCYTQLQRLSEAREAFQMAVAYSPYSYRAHQALADLAFAEGRLAEAYGAYSTALQLAAEAHITNLHALKRLGLIAYMGRLYASARDHFLAYARCVPGDLEVNAALLYCFEMLGEFEQGAALYEEWAQSNPGSVAIDLPLAQMYLAKRQPENSLRAASRVLDATDADLSAQQRALLRTASGRAHAALGEIDAATAAFYAAIADDKQLTDAYKALAAVLAENKQPAAGIQVLEQWLTDETLSPSDGERAEVLALLGRIYAANDQLPRAREVLERARALNPNDPGDIMALAAVLMRMNNHDQAAALLREAIADPNINAGTAELADMHYYLARALTKAKRYDEAVQQVRAILPLVGPQEALALRIQLTLALEDAKREQEALREAEALVADYPDDPQTLNLLGYMYAERAINLATAEQLIIKALSFAPDDGNIVDSLGWVYYQNEQYEKAVVELERAVELTGGDPVIYDHLGDAYYKVGRLDDAIKFWELAVESGHEQKEELRAKLERARGSAAQPPRRP